MPSKLYGILAAGRPYVAAVEDDCEVAAHHARHQCGLVAEPGNASSLADRLVAFYRDRDDDRALRRKHARPRPDVRSARSGAALLRSVHGRAALAARPASARRREEAACQHDDRVPLLTAWIARPPTRGARAAAQPDPCRAKRAFDVGCRAPASALLAAALGARGDRHQARGRRRRLLRPGARRPGRPRVPRAEVPIDDSGRGGQGRRAAGVAPAIRASRASATGCARPRMDELPQLLEHLPRRHELRRSARAAARRDRSAAATAGTSRSRTCRASKSAAACGRASPASRRSTRRATSRAATSSGTTASTSATSRSALDLRLIALSFWITFRGTWEVRGRSSRRAARGDRLARRFGYDTHLHMIKVDACTT